MMTKRRLASEGRDSSGSARNELIGADSPTTELLLAWTDRRASFLEHAPLLLFQLHVLLKPNDLVYKCPCSLKIERPCGIRSLRM